VPETVTVIQDKGIAKLFLNRPAVFNAFDHPMVEHLTRHLFALRTSPYESEILNNTRCHRIPIGAYQ
jgi:enoyl-CoA hydratase/carnithine racemase